MKEIIEQIRQFNHERDWEQFHSPANLAKSLVIEAGELLELYQWSDDVKSEQDLKEELADVLSYALMLADHYHFDIEQIMRDKIKKMRASIRLARQKEKPISTTIYNNRPPIMENHINDPKQKENLLHIIKFVLFSISAGIIQALTFTLLFEVIKWIYWPAYLVALILSVLWNFTLNRKFTFKSANNIPIAMLKVALFYLVFTPLSTWWGDALTKVGCNEYLVLAFTMVINLITEYLYTKYFVYHKAINTAVKPKK